MNNLTDVKFDEMYSNVELLDKKIYEHKDCQDAGLLRTLFDLRRQLISDIENHEQKFGNNETADNHFSSGIKRVVDKIAADWSQKISKLPNCEPSFENGNFCDLFLDYTFPNSWDFKNDVLVIISPPSELIIEYAQERGQKYIVVLDESNGLRSPSSNFSNAGPLYFCQNLTELEISFVLMEAVSEKVVTLNCTQKKGCFSEHRQKIATAISNGRKNRLANTMTAVRFGKAWSENVIKNLPAITKFPNLHQIKVDGICSAVIVASGPSLKKNVGQLAKIQNSVFIISALRSLPTLTAAGVIPDLVIQLDAEDDKAASNAVKDGFPIKNLLLELSVNSGFFDLKADQKIWSLPGLFFDTHKFFRTQPTPFDSPSVSIYALLLCLHLNFRNICFVGQDLAASGNQQYADEELSLLPKHHDISSFNISVPGFHGDTVKTRNAYFHQIKRCTNIAAEVQKLDIDIQLINATEGGAHIDGFQHMTFQDFAGKHINENAPVSKELSISRNHQVPKKLFSEYLINTMKILDDIRVVSDKIIELEWTKGNAVNVNPDCSTLVEKFRDLNSQTSLLQISMQDEITRTTGTSIDGTAIRTNLELFTQVRDNAQRLMCLMENTQTAC